MDLKKRLGKDVDLIQGYLMLRHTERQFGLFKGAWSRMQLIVILDGMVAPPFVSLFLAYTIPRLYIWNDLRTKLE